MKIVKAILELAGIVLLRFRLPARLWAILLIVLNAASLFFINTIYGQVAFASVLIAVVIMTAIYLKCGFVRLLGIGHILWIPMIPWLVLNLPGRSESPLLYDWVVCLIAGNSISLVIDTIDLARFLKGDRDPHYTWVETS